MGIILGALVGAGNAVSDIARDERKRMDLEEHDTRRSALEVEKAKALSNFGMGQRQIERGQIRQEDADYAPIKREQMVADERAKLGIRLDPQIQQLQQDAKVRELTATEQAKLDFATRNQEAITGVDKAHANAKESDADRALKEAHATAYLAKEGGGVNLSREERIRYTTLFSKASDREKEARKALTKMLGDPLFAMQSKMPGSPEAGQLADLRQSIEDNSQERKMYGEYLVQSQASPNGQSGGIIKGAAEGAKSGGSTSVTRAEYDALPKGAAYTAPDGSRRIKR